jgi:hypothetical protein
MAEDVLRDGERRAVDLGREYETVHAVPAEHAAASTRWSSPASSRGTCGTATSWSGTAPSSRSSTDERAFYGDPLIEVCFAGTVLPASAGC